MKYLGVFLLTMVVVFSAWPALGLWQIVWQDRKLPRTHPDYSWSSLGKWTVVLAAAFCSLVAIAAVWTIRWCLK